MKKLTTILFILGMMGMASLSWGQLNFPGSERDPEGFRGLKWGDRPTKNMVLVPGPKGEEIIIYRRSSDKMKIGDAKLNSINYLFYKKGLMSVMIYSLGKQNYENLKVACFETFGIGDQEKDGFTWGFYEKQIGVGRTIIILRHDERKEETYLQLNSKKYFEEQKEQIEREKQKPKGGAKKDF